MIIKFEETFLYVMMLNRFVNTKNIEQPLSILLQHFWHLDDTSTLINFNALRKKWSFLLTHYSLVLLFYTPWKYQKTFRFLDVFRGYRKPWKEELLPSFNISNKRDHIAKKGNLAWSRIQILFQKNIIKI